MDITLINGLAVVVAALSSFVIGALWYSPLMFSNIWQREVNLSDKEVQQANMGKIFGFAFVFEVIMAANLAAFLATPETTTSWGATAGFLAGLWIFCGLAVAYLFAQKSWKLIFIDGLYQVIALVVMGTVLGFWR